MKKPTGKPGEAKDRIFWCIAIECKIIEKTHSGLLGIMESDAEDRGDDEEGGVLMKRFLGVGPQHAHPRREQINVFAHSLHLLESPPQK